MKRSVVGYTGGRNQNPTYETVCEGDGHSEAIQLEFDEHDMSYEDLIGVFCRVHYPNTSGKKQYRSAIMYHNQQQKQAAEKVLRKNNIDNPAELLQPATSWYDAEDYHQKYAEKQLAMWGDYD